MTRVGPPKWSFDPTSASAFPSGALPVTVSGRPVPGMGRPLPDTAPVIGAVIAAIPAVIAYNYFLTRIRKLVFRVEAFNIEFLNSIEELTKEPKEVEVGR